MAENVRVISSRGEHPDRDPLQKGYFGTWDWEGDEPEVDVVVHRKSDGSVEVVDGPGSSGGGVVVLVLGRFDRGFPGARALSAEEHDAVARWLDENGHGGKPVAASYGLEQYFGASPEEAEASTPRARRAEAPPPEAEALPSPEAPEEPPQAPDEAEPSG